GYAGIYAHVYSYADGNDGLVVSDNRVHDNAGTGIETYGGDGRQILVTGNTVYSNAETGINVAEDTEALNNVVYNNRDGIRQVPRYLGADGFTATADLIHGNVVYGNTNIGISALVDSTVYSNVVYGNAIGISGEEHFFSNQGFSSDLRFDGTILNNVVQDNSSAGILVQ